VPTRERTYRTEAIILRRKDIGETDRLLTVLTPEKGKIRVVGKGIRKPRSRKAGHLELFVCAKVLLAKGHEFDLVTQAEMVNAYRPLREDLLRTAHASYAVELLDKFTPDSEEHRELYELLRHALEWLCTAADVPLATRYYELQLLTLAGFQPQLHRCAQCGEVLKPEDQFFSVLDGGVVCRACAAPAEGFTLLRPGLVPLSLNALKVLRYFQTQPYAKATAVAISQTTQNDVERILARYIISILERQLKSVEFLKLIRREAQT
jgi:DNA repair protein RecO (recombination protein O)